MGYRSLRAAVNDLEQTNQLIRIPFEVDPNLEIAEIHRKVHMLGGPALLFENVKGSPFQAVSNIYGTKNRIDFLFRREIGLLEKVVQLKINPVLALQNPLRYFPALRTAITGLPLSTKTNCQVCRQEISISKIPQIVSWPKDGGAFVTLPQVITEAPESKSIMKSNIGMYRIQLSGNDYIPNQEVGMHYQLHRGIGVHHQAYNHSDLPFKATIAIGGPPSHALAAIFPLPEGLSEMTFAGMLTGRRYRYHRRNGHVISNDADFCITGTISKQTTKMEGPFGDHLGYYSLAHPFPVMKVDKVFYRPDPIWHFTVVGRPPQEDSFFGYMIHRIIGDLIPTEFPGVREVNAVDEAGVHPLLLAIGSERYMPFRDQKPEEILTQANHILGSGQTSLAKYLLIVGGNDHPQLSTHNYSEFFNHLLRRIDLRRDLHFQTKTTIDTLDYSGEDWNAGSKLVIGAYGPEIRTLGTSIPNHLENISAVQQTKLFIPGILLIQTSKFTTYTNEKATMKNLLDALQKISLNEFPLVVLVDDVRFTGSNWPNFLWVTFTRSNPAKDTYGVNESIEDKHWGCDVLLIDARIKPHHAPVLETDPSVEKRVQKLMEGHSELRKYLA